MVLTLSLEGEIFGESIHVKRLILYLDCLYLLTQKSWRGLGSDANAVVKTKARSPNKRMGEAICKF